MALATQSTGDLITATIWNTMIAAVNLLSPGAATVTTTGTSTAYAPPSTNTLASVVWTAASGWTIQGIVAGTVGQRLTINNAGSASITLEHESGSATAVNRIYFDWNSMMGGVLYIPIQQSVTLEYTNLARWQVVSVTGSSAKANNTTTGNQTAMALPFGTGPLVLNWAGVSATFIMGIGAGQVGQLLTIINNSGTAGCYIELLHENAGASAANRLNVDWVGGNKVVLRRNQSATLVYTQAPSGSLRWLITSVNTLPEWEYDNGNSGATKTIDFAVNGPMQKVTRTGNCTYTLTAPSFPGTYLLKFIHESGNSNAYTVTFSPTVKTPAGAALVFTNSSAAVDILTFYWDGVSYNVVGQSNFA